MVKCLIYICFLLIAITTFRNSVYKNTKPIVLDTVQVTAFSKSAKDVMVLKFIKRRCKETWMPERLVHNIIMIERSWKYPIGNNVVGDSMVQSNRDAYGLMQVQLPTAWEMMNDNSISESLLMNNDTLNIEIGIRYLVWLRKYYNGNFYFAITAYNRGISNVDSDISDGINPISTYMLLSTKGVFFGKKITQKMHNEMKSLRAKTRELTSN